MAPRQESLAGGAPFGGFRDLDSPFTVPPYQIMTANLKGPYQGFLYQEGYCRLDHETVMD